MSSAYKEQDLRERIEKLSEKFHAIWQGLALVCSCGKWTYKSYADKEGTQVQAQWEEHIRSLPDLAADEAIERIREEAHEAALPFAAEQIIGALTEGGDFAEGSPLAKVIQAIERIKREARLEARIDEWRYAVVYFLSADLHGNDIEKIKEYIKSHSADLNHQLAALSRKEPSQP